MKKLTIEEVILNINKFNSNITLLSTEYEDCMSKMDFKCNICGNEWKTRYTDIRQGLGCPICGIEKMRKSKKHSIEDIVATASIYKPNIKILSTEYTNKNDKASVECKVCGYEWEVQWRKLYEKSTNKSNCPCCSGQVVSDKNSIFNNRKDLLKYIVNEEDSKNTSIGSRKIIKTKCPTCGNIKEMSASDLSRKPYSCKICSDNVSKPEKFTIRLLNEVGIEYEYQKKFEWSEGKIYDFYIPSLSLIIETHGDQHYRESKFKNTLEEQQNIDAYKRLMALNNGIHNYEEVNLSKDSYLYMKTNIIKSLKKYFDLSNINFEKCYEYCLNSNIKYILDMLKTEYTFEDIKYELKISDYLLSEYLKKAKELKLL